GDTENAVRVLTSITEQMLTGREENRLMELLGEVLEHDPDQIPALRLLIRIYAWQRDDENMRVAVERLLEAAQAAESVEDERHALEQLVRLAPDQTHYIERLQAIGGASLATLSYEEPEHAPPVMEVPSFEHFAPDNQPACGEPEPVKDFGIVEEPSPVVQAADPSMSFADLNDWADGRASLEAEPEAFAQPAAGEANEFVFGGTEYFESPAPAEPKVVECEPPAPAVMDERRRAVWRQELESVDFYVAQGYADIAVDTLDLLERQFGPHEEIESRRAALGAPPSSVAAPVIPSAPADAPEQLAPAPHEIADEPSDTGAVDVEMDGVLTHQFEIVNTEPVLVEHASSSSAPAAAKPAAGIDPGLAAIFDEFRTAVEDEEPPHDDSDYETHYNLGLAYKEMDLLDEAVEEFQMAANLVGPADGTPRYLQCCNLLGHCFMQKRMPRIAVMWFKKGLESPGNTEDEYQALRYELGTAYEALGDLDRALDTFTEIYGVNVTYRGVADKLRELESQRMTKVEVRR
ncbi:MAG TPA: hypothetical protein VF507_06990, partial [Pyrinomonadaceae bacterium]